MSLSFNLWAYSKTSVIAVWLAVFAHCTIVWALSLYCYYFCHYCHSCHYCRWCTPRYLNSHHSCPRCSRCSQTSVRLSTQQHIDWLPAPRWSPVRLGSQSSVVGSTPPDETRLQPDQSWTNSCQHARRHDQNIINSVTAVIQLTLSSFLWLSKVAL